MEIQKEICKYIKKNHIGFYGQRYFKNWRVKGKKKRNWNNGVSVRLSREPEPEETLRNRITWFWGLQVWNLQGRLVGWKLRQNLIEQPWSRILPRREALIFFLRPSAVWMKLTHTVQGNLKILTSPVCVFQHQQTRLESSADTDWFSTNLTWFWLSLPWDNVRTNRLRVQFHKTVLTSDANI